MRWFWKHWPWLPPSRTEAIAIAITGALLAAVLVAMIKFPHGVKSFGPDWDCSPTPYGGCVKRDSREAPVSKDLAPSK